MTVRWAHAALVASVFIVLACGAGVASAATTQIGASAEVAAAAAPDPITDGGFAVQARESGGTYAVPAGYGRITRWSHSTGSASGNLTLKVYRPTGTPKEFRVVAADVQTVTAGAVATFPVDITVQPGDRIGLSSKDVQLAYQTNDPADRIGFFGTDPTVGSTRTTDGEPFPDYKLDVSATLESAPGTVPAASPAPLPANGGAAPSPIPTITALQVTPVAFVAARRGPGVPAGRSGRRTGARVRLTSRRPSTVRFTVQQQRVGRRRGDRRTPRCAPATRATRAAPRCSRLVRLAGSFIRAVPAGASAFTYSGRLGGRRLGPGSYVLVATPSADGRTGPAARVRFRVTT